LLTAGHEGEGAHSVQVKLTQWKPVPVRVIINVFPGAAPVTVSVPVRPPPWVGANVTLTVHVARPPSIAGQLFV